MVVNGWRHRFKMFTRNSKINSHLKRQQQKQKPKILASAVCCRRCCSFWSHTKRIWFGQWHFEHQRSRAITGVSVCVCLVHYILFADASFSLLNRNLGVLVLDGRQWRWQSTYIFLFVWCESESWREEKRQTKKDAKKDRGAMRDDDGVGRCPRIANTRWKVKSSSMLFIIRSCRSIWSKSCVCVPGDREHSSNLDSANLAYCTRRRHTIDKVEN